MTLIASFSPPSVFSPSFSPSCITEKISRRCTCPPDISGTFRTMLLIPKSFVDRRDIRIDFSSFTLVQHICLTISRRETRMSTMTVSIEHGLPQIEVCLISVVVDRNNSLSDVCTHGSRSEQDLVFRKNLSQISLSCHPFPIISPTRKFKVRAALRVSATSSRGRTELTATASRGCVCYGDVFGW